MMNIKETPGDVHGRSWCLLLPSPVAIASLHFCMNTKRILHSSHTIPSNPARVKSHLFPFRFIIVVAVGAVQVGCFN